jgi:hypothetical protein
MIRSCWRQRPPRAPGASNARLQGDVRAGCWSQPPHGLVEAGIEQRRRLEEELRVGAERRLAAVAGRLSPHRRS